MRSAIALALSGAAAEAQNLHDCVVPSSRPDFLRAFRPKLFA